MGMDESVSSTWAFEMHLVAYNFGQYEQFIRYSCGSTIHPIAIEVGLIEDRARVVRSLGPIRYSARPGKQFPPSTSITKLIGDWFRLQIYFADRAWRLNKQSKLLAGVIAVPDVSPEPVPEHHDL